MHFVQVIKKVIAYMTLGIDVSKLFSDMIMVRGTVVYCYRTCLCAHVLEGLYYGLHLRFWVNLPRHEKVLRHWLSAH